MDIGVSSSENIVPTSLNFNAESQRDEEEGELNEEEEEDDEEEEPGTPMSMKNPFYNKIAISPLAFSGELSFTLLMLRWVPEFANFQTLRTEDPEIIEQCGMIFSTNGKFDTERLIFSRQKDLNFEGFPSSMGLAGIIYCIYGRTAIKNHYNIPDFDDPSDLNFLMMKIYKSLIEPLDTMQDCDISRLASMLDPSNDPDPFVKQESTESLMSLIEEQIEQRVRWITKTMMPGRSFLRRSMEERKKVLPTGEILYLPHFVPLFLHKDVIDPDETKKQSIKYIVMGRPTNDAIVHTFSWRQNFKRLNLRGKSGDQLTGLLQNITGTGWVHPNGALAQWNSLSNALEFSKQMLKAPEKV